MAKVSIGTDVTGMSSIGSKAGTFIAPPVQDNSEVYGIGAQTDLIKGLASAVHGATTGYVVAGAKQELRDTWGEYEAASPSVFQAENETMNRARLQAAGESPEGASAILEKQKSLIGKYKNALAQGAMSEAEFVLQTKKHTSAAVANSPFFQKEIISGLQQEYEALGITSTLAADRAFNKLKEDSADKMLNKAREEADKRDLPWNPEDGLDELIPKINEHKVNEIAYDGWKRGQERYTVAKRDQAVKWTQTHGDKVVLGGVSAFGKQALNIATAAGEDPANYPKYKAQVEMAGQTNINAFVAAIPADLRDEPAVKETIAAYKDGVNTYLKMLENVGSGADMKKAHENAEAVASALNTKELRSRVNPEALKMIAQLNAMNPSMTALNSETRKQVNNVLESIATVNPNSPALKASGPKSESDKNLSQHITTGIATWEKDKDAKVLTNTLTTYNLHQPMIKNEKDRKLFAVTNLEAIARSKLEDAPPEVVVEVLKMVEQTMDDPTFGSKVLMDNMVKYKPTVTTTKTGEIIFTGNEGQAFNEKLGKIYNASLLAFVRATKSAGGDIEEAKAFNNKYLFRHLPQTKVVK